MTPMLGIMASGFTLPVYTLAQTFTTSGTFTVATGHTKIAIKGVGAGGGGQGPFEGINGGWSFKNCFNAF